MIVAITHIVPCIRQFLVFALFVGSTGCSAGFLGEKKPSFEETFFIAETAVLKGSVNL